MKKPKRILFRLGALLILTFTLSSCGLFFGRGWGCGGPHYYDDQGSSNQYNRSYDNR